MEIEGQNIQTKFDWLRRDRDLYLMLSYNQQPPFPSDFLTQSTFCKACIEITKVHKPDEFKTIRQRNAYYDFISYLFEFSNLPDKKAKQIKFFHATTVVTTWNVIGAAESIGRKIALSNESINILSDVNKILFLENMFVIRYLLFSDNLKIPFKFVNNSPCVINPVEISCFDFDIQMVVFEQSIVANYISSNTQKFTKEIINEINKTLNPNWFVDYLVKPLNISSDFALPWSKSALNVKDLDFMNYKHRTTIGFATVHFFHRKTFSEFNSFINK